MSNPVDQPTPVWLRPLYHALRLEPSAAVKEVFQKADALALRLAPNTRSLWKWILMLEGTSVVLPMLWLFVVRLKWEPLTIAWAVLLCTVLALGLCWWRRWRGMQHTFTRARLLAEIARSAQTTAWIPGRATVRALASAPALQAIADELPETPDAKVTDLAQLKARYLKERIEDQADHYVSKRRDAIEDRQRISRAVTHSLDGALFLAVAGVVFAWDLENDYLVRISGVDCLLAALGTLLPLVAVLMQSLSAYMELARRTARYAQQISFLKVAATRMQAAENEAEVLALIHETEASLLGEVVEWFYQADQAEIFYRPVNFDESATIREVVAQSTHPFYRRMLKATAASTSFIISVLFTRVLIAALAVVITIAGINQLHKKSVESQSELVVAGRMLSRFDATAWAPAPERTQRGFVLIAHGLKDGAHKQGDTVLWMKRLQEAIEQDLQPTPPEVCLVDWHERAGNPSLSPDFLSALSAITPQAEEVGELIGCKLAMAVHLGKLDPARPMHFIGHSAGGFVVMKAARTLDLLGIEMKNLRITILDTPKPNITERGDLIQLLSRYPIDYYCTSTYTLVMSEIPQDHFLPNFTRFDLGNEVPEKKGQLNGAHSYIYDWFIKSIGKKVDGIEKTDPRGFARSPFRAVPPQ